MLSPSQGVRETFEETHMEAGRDTGSLMSEVFELFNQMATNLMREGEDLTSGVENNPILH